jgi:hypothetical protein
VTLARFTEQQGGEKPLLQGEMRVIEDRAGRDGKLIIAGLAVEELFFRGEFHGGSFAARAFDSIRPAEPDQHLAALLVGIEQVYNVN